MIAVDGLIVLAVLAAVPAIVYNVWRWARIGTASGNDRTPADGRQLVATVAAPMSSADAWFEARTLADGVRDEYAGYLLDPVQAFRYPLLNEVSASSTQVFLDALAAYNAVEPEHGPTTAAQAKDLLELARTLRRTWVAAYDRAQIVGLDYLSEPHRERVERAIKALMLALDPATTDAERRNAYMYALRLVDGIVSVHRDTRGALHQAVERLAIEGHDDRA